MNSVGSGFMWGLFVIVVVKILTINSHLANTRKDCASLREVVVNLKDCEHEKRIAGALAILYDGSGD